MNAVLMDCAGGAERRRRFGGRGWFESGVDAPLCHRSPWGFTLRTFTGLLPLLFWGAVLLSRPLQCAVTRSVDRHTECPPCQTTEKIL